ncbi:MAG: prepilin-type N-terminal cleavage/methylation domain-containing protein [Candidatus Paceibacterota bacterium]
MPREIKYFKKDGFTLIETLIYVFIFSLFIIGAVSFMSSLTSSRLRNQTVLEVNDQGSKAMKTMTQAIRNASNVNSPTISNTASNLSLVTYTPVTSPTVFSESGGVLYITEGLGAPTALTNNKVIVNNLAFSNLSRPATPDIIKISFNLASQAASSSLGGSYSFTFNGSANLRK